MKTELPVRRTFSEGIPLACLLALLLAGQTLTAQSLPVKGVVRDPSGAAIAGALVELKAGSFHASQATDTQGRFSFSAVPSTSGTIAVHASGFADLERGWNPGATIQDIVLSPASVNQQVVVTATRTETRLSDVAGSAVVLAPQDLNATPALLVDDKLRQIPGFSLFRRSDSRTANPTSQGVSLNGLGASGASRVLVLEDGVPLNDPFGGWIYWGRIPQEELASLEVVRGGISSLYGSNALGGVIQFLARQPEEGPEFSLETSYGSEQTPDLSFWAGEEHGPWNAAVAADLFRTDGYVLVPVADRGSVDTPANAKHASVDITVGRKFGSRPAYSAEVRFSPKRGITVLRFRPMTPRSRKACWARIRNWDPLALFPCVYLATCKATTRIFLPSLRTA